MLKNKKKRTPRTRVVHNFDTAKTAGILFDAGEPDSFHLLLDFTKYLKSNGIKSKMLGFVESKEIPDNMVLRDNCELLTLNDIDLWMRPRTPEAVDFTNSDFNILFDVSMRDNFILHYLSTLSVANFKVGRYKTTENDYDFMINVEKKPSVEYLLEQIKIYVSILNKTREQSEI